MNKLGSMTLALAAAGYISSSTVQADNDLNVDIYGKINVALLNLDDGLDTSWELESNASRLGFKGAFEISDDIEAIYQLEYEIAIDDGDAGNENSFKLRNI